MSENYEMDNDLGGMDAFDSDFNVDSDYKPTPIAIGGNYSGNVTGVKLDSKHACIVWDVSLAENDGVVCSDGETEVDGIQLEYRNFLPKVNDKHELNRRGVSKFQSKVNMLKQFSEGMGINMNTLSIIREAIENAEWIGIPVTVKVSIESYAGRPINKITSMVVRS
jgi:hypothetical protein